MVGSRLEDLLQVLGRLLVLAGVPIRAGKMQTVAGLGIVGRHGLAQQGDRFIVPGCVQGVAAPGEPLFGRGLLRLGFRLIGLLLGRRRLGTVICRCRPG